MLVIQLIFVLSLQVPVLTEEIPDATIDGIPAVRSWASERVLEAEKDWKRRHGTLTANRLQSPTFWGDEIIYQIMPDRFNNGNLSNDELNLPQQQRQAKPNDPEGLPDYRHGGDIAGITERLDYIADLGATSLWLTPILHHDGSYHGYCTTDPTILDPGTGTLDELHLLISEAHKRGIRIILDIVVNHLCDANTSYSTLPSSHEDCANTLNEYYWNGSDPLLVPEQGQLNFSNSFFPAFRTNKFFNRCGANSGSDTSSQKPVAVFGDFTASMFDLNTRNEDLMTIFTDLLKYWIAIADFDGFRFDAAKHITDDFVAFVCSNIRDYAENSLGKANFFIIGEVAASSDWEGRALGQMFSDPDNPSQHGNVPAAVTNMLMSLKSTYLAHKAFPVPGLNSVYDFEMSGTLRDVLHNIRAPQAVADYYFSTDYKTLSAQADPRVFWNLVEIHDWPRFLHDTQVGNLQVGALALCALFTVRGAPIIWAGFEQGFAGRCKQGSIHAGDASDSINQTCIQNMDPTWRQDMFASGPWRLESIVETVDEQAYVGVTEHSLSPSWTKDSMLPRDHLMYKTTKQVTSIRKSCEPLTHEEIVFRSMSTTAGTGRLIYSRLSETSEIVVLMNAGQSASTPGNITISASINNASAGILYVDMFNATLNATIAVDETGQNTWLYFDNDFALQPYEFMILGRHDQVTPFNVDDGHRSCLSS